MDIGSILLILALIVPVALFVARPFFSPRLAKQDSLTMAEDHDLSGLLAERDRILTALQELEFDHVLGKIPDDDYPSQRASLVQRGADLLRKLDQMQAPGSEAGDVVDRVEEAISRRRADAACTAVAGEPISSPGSAAVVDDDLEAVLAQRRRQRQEKSAGFCPQCGGPVQKSDRFCPKCGTTLAH